MINSLSYALFFAKLTVIFGAFFLVSCASSSIGVAKDIKSDPRYVESFPEVDLVALVLDSDLDVFKVGDIATVDVYNVESLSRDYIVDGTGNVEFPLIGTLKVAGLSTLDLQGQLTNRYGADYLQKPSISVTMDSRPIGKIVVDGAVNGPGVFELDNKVRLSTTIALAQGVNDVANRKEVLIVRTINGARKVTSVNLNEVRTAMASDPLIIPNDLIYVPDSRSRVVFNEILKGLPLLNTASIIATR